MATAVVSVRIDRDLKDQVSALAQASGTTIVEIVKKNLQEVARTKQVPVSDEERARWAAQHKCFEEFMEWRATLSPCPELATLTDEQMKDMIASKYD